MSKPKLDCETVPLNQHEWQPLPATFSAGGATWQLLHVSPEAGSWTAAFRYPKGSSVPSHVHVGPGEYFLMRGKLEVRGGDYGGGDTVTAPSYGYEATGARHHETLFLEDSEVYMRFQGPLQMVDSSGKTVGVYGWEEVQALWTAQNQKQSSKRRRKVA